MEVTRTNFTKLLPEIREAIDKSTFLTVDCEFTGLNTCNDINAYDTQKLYYEKISRSIKNFAIIQYGLCAFRYDEESDAFKQSAYNFYIFRKPVNRNVPDVRFLCQSSSIDFLSSHGFDFNKLFREGISFMNLQDEEKYKKMLEEKQKTRSNGMNNYLPAEEQSNIPISPEDKPFIDDIIQKIEDFIETDASEMNLPKCNAFLRRLIYQTAQSKYYGKVNLETKQLENKDRVICVTKFKSKEDLQELENKKAQEELNEFAEMIGFTNVIRHIVNSGKLVIGHNICLDLLHTVDKFLTVLPKDYEEFKECVTSLFKSILDTKLMSSLQPFKEHVQSTVLAHLLSAVTKEPFDTPKIDIEENREGYTLSCNKEHEAGYDAYITGMAFLSMWKYLGDQKKMQNADIFKDHGLIAPYINKLYIMKVFDGLYINLGGADLQPKRDHVLFLTFPREWKTSNIIQLFSPFGQVYVAYIDDQSAYVGLQKPEQLPVALKTLSQSDTYKVMTYEKRQRILEFNRQNMKNQRSTATKKRQDVDHDEPPKRKKTLSVGENSIINETEPSTPTESALLQSDDMDYGVPVERPKRKRTFNKAFQEDSTWE